MRKKKGENGANHAGKGAIPPDETITSCCSVGSQTIRRRFVVEHR
jgi:hypothetical protein